MIHPSSSDGLTGGRTDGWQQGIPLDQLRRERSSAIDLFSEAWAAKNGDGGVSEPPRAVIGFLPQTSVATMKVCSGVMHSRYSRSLWPSGKHEVSILLSASGALRG